MSGGLTSYPRTGGGGGSPLVAINYYLGQLNAGSQALNDGNSNRLLAALSRYAVERTQAGAYADIVAKSIEVRNALFIASNEGRTSGPHHRKAMEICADAYKASTPLASTSLQPRSQLAIIGAANASSTTQLRGFKEEIGLIAWLYEASALMGEDLNQSIQANCQTATPHGDWRIARTPTNELTSVEPAGAYNVNIVIRVKVPGSAQPLIVVGEAKGGRSEYRSAGGPKDLQAVLAITPPTGQNTLKYAVSRALYMQRTKGTRPHEIARKQAGEMIIKAYHQNRLVFLAARGDVIGNGQSSKRDNLECK